MDTSYFLDEAELAAQAAAYVADQAAQAISERGAFHFAVSGGKSPARMFEALSERDLDWSKVSLFQVDERILPHGDPGRNSTMLEQSLLRRLHLAPRVFLMPVEREPHERARDDYEQLLQKELGPGLVLDLVHLGLGADGHTASLLPGDRAVLAETKRLCALTRAYQGTTRLTLTAPMLRRAKKLLWLVAGADKATALNQFERGDPAIPATLLADVPSVVFALDDTRTRG
jgi:6-phosphogluconolactonase